MYDRCASLDLTLNGHNMKTFLEPTDESGRAFFSTTQPVRILRLLHRSPARKPVVCT
jgi:hypothetical protein